MSKSKNKLSAKISSATVKAGGKKSTKPAAFMTAKRQHMISVAAYFLAEQRGFSSGDELGDWLQADSQINARLTQKGG